MFTSVQLYGEVSSWFLLVLPSLRIWRLPPTSSQLLHFRGYWVAQVIERGRGLAYLGSLLTALTKNPKTFQRFIPINFISHSQNPYIMFLNRWYVNQFSWIHKQPPNLSGLQQTTFYVGGCRLAVDSVSLFKCIWLCSICLFSPQPKLKEKSLCGMYHFHGSRQKQKKKKNLAESHSAF